MPPSSIHGPELPAHLARGLQRKRELEAAMLAAPNDGAPRAAYFELLASLAGSGSGLLWAHLPEVGAPLALRAGTPDIASLTAVFRDGGHRVELPHPPRRILLIGAYVGYVAVDLALRHPAAALLALEPLRDNFRLLAANVAPWERIRPVQIAAWHSKAMLNPIRRWQSDWSIQLSDEMLKSQKVIPALPLDDILAEQGWRHADMIVCDICGGERALFADPLRPWIRGCDTLLVRRYAAPGPGDDAAVDRAFPPATFERRMAGQLQVLTRRAPPPPVANPPEWLLLSPLPGLRPFSLLGVPPSPWGFFVFDGASCQLHPNPPGAEPTGVIFEVPRAGYTKLLAEITHAGPPGHDAVVFMALGVGADGAILARAEMPLIAFRTAPFEMALPGPDTVTRIVLRTAMAPGARSNANALARWLRPRLV